MTTPRQQQPPSHIVAMIAGAVMGELLLLLGLLWFLWQNASDSCAPPSTWYQTPLRLRAST